jgi:hypothetical protein
VYSSPHPPGQDYFHRLDHSGWSCGEAGFTGRSGRTVWQVDGSNGDNKLRVEGATPAEAWHPAIETAAACGMLRERPKTRTRSGKSGSDVWSSPLTPSSRQ